MSRAPQRTSRRPTSQGDESDSVRLATLGQVRRPPRMTTTEIRLGRARRARVPEGSLNPIDPLDEIEREIAKTERFVMRHLHPGEIDEWTKIFARHRKLVLRHGRAVLIGSRREIKVKEASIYASNACRMVALCMASHKVAQAGEFYRKKGRYLIVLEGA